MKEGWTYKKLGEICRIGIGRTPSRSDISLWDKNKETHNYWVSIADMGATENGYIFDTKEYISDKAAENIQIIPKGTLLLSFKLTLGKTAIAGTDLYTNEAIANLPFICNEINREFLSYYFQFFNWEKYSAGDEKVLGKTLNKKKLDVLPVYYPSLEVQQRIVSRLDVAFAHIDELKANAEKQLSEARALFQKSLAKAMKPKEGWEEKALGDVCTLSQGLAINSHTKHLFIQNGSLPLLRIKDMKEGTREIFVDEANCPQGCIASEEDIIYTRTGTLGLVFTGMHGVLHNNCFKIKHDINKLNKSFLIYFLRNDSFVKTIIGLASRAAQPDITHKLFKAQEIHFPPLAEQQRIVERLDALSENIRKYEEIQRQIISECDALKQALLRQVFE